MIIVSVLIGMFGGVLIGMGLWLFWQWNALQALLIGVIYGAILGCWWEWSTQAATMAQKTAPAEAYIPASERELAQPLLTDIDFRDRDVPPTLSHETTVETPTMKIIFEEYGAVVKKIIHKRILNNALGELVMFEVNPLIERERGAFLVAGDRDTPLAYRLLAHTENNGTHSVRFSVEGDGYTLEKEFVIYSDSYRIDLHLKLTQVTSPLQLRVLLPAPHVASISGDTLTILACSQLKPIKKYILPDVVGRAWESPTLFGIENRYFIMSMVHDNNSFTTRAYARSQGLKDVTAILESRVISKPKNYTLSFYCGPKERAAMDLVDARLVSTLNYGWFTPISTLLFALLTFIYNIIGNYGWAIIILALLLKLLMLPFMARAEKTAKKMAELQRKLQLIDRKYKDNPERRDYERAELIKAHGFGGLFGAGLLPHLVRLVMFFGLNRVLSVAVELYQAPFVGWIHDLAAPDPLYILPALAGLGTFLAMRKATDARQVVTIIMFSMIIVGVMVNLAAGVVLYLAVSTWLDIAQQYIQQKIKT